VDKEVATPKVSTFKTGWKNIFQRFFYNLSLQIHLFFHPISREQQEKDMQNLESGKFGSVPHFP
jgi:hypothetical protein